MPTYDYKCLDCGNTFEHFQRITEEPLSECPVCSGHVKRLIGAGSAPIFKGSGFYQTDYKNSSSKRSDTSKSGGGEKKSG
jgi:putative FmdB family regulatory protein